MAKLINIGFGNVVNSQKIVAVVNPECEGNQFPCRCHPGQENQVCDRDI